MQIDRTSIQYKTEEFKNTGLKVDRNINLQKLVEVRYFHTLSWFGFQTETNRDEAINSVTTGRQQVSSAD